MVDYSSFRQRLDAVLRTLDVKQVQDFLIAEGQWSTGKPANPDFAMWMMIAGNPTLHDVHDRAREWLVTHGHEADAEAFLAREKKQGTGPNRGGTSKSGRGSSAGAAKAGSKKPSNMPSEKSQKSQKSSSKE